jgi:hypothetical protein
MFLKLTSITQPEGSSFYHILYQFPALVNLITPTIFGQKTDYYEVSD